MLQLLLFTLALLAFFAGVLMGVTSRNAIHDVQAGVAFLVFAVCLAGGAVVSAINRLERRLLDRSESHKTSVE